jgi:Protein of unknown function (DUF3987)
MLAWRNSFCTSGPDRPARTPTVPALCRSPCNTRSCGSPALLEGGRNDDWNDRHGAHKRDCAAAKERRSRSESEIKIAVKADRPPPDMPADAEDPEPPQPRRLFSTEPTVQKAALLVHSNPRGLLLVRDELAGWIGGMDLYSRGDDNDGCKSMAGGRPWTPDRVKDGENAKIIPHVLWGLTGGIQPDRVASKLLAGDDDGLAARLIYAWPAPLPPLRPLKAPNHVDALAALERLIELPWDPPEPVILPFTEDAAAALQAFREEVADLEQGVVGMFLSWHRKLPGFCVRLSVIIQHLEWCRDGLSPPPRAVDLPAVGSAADFLENYAVPMARRVFGEAALPQAERDAHAIARWLVKQTPIPEIINEWDLRRMRDGPGIRDVDRMAAALGELAQVGWVRPAPARASGYGRQRHDWVVNPAQMEWPDELARPCRAARSAGPSRCRHTQRKKLSTLLALSARGHFRQRRTTQARRNDLPPVCVPLVMLIPCAIGGRADRAIAPE